MDDDSAQWSVFERSRVAIAWLTAAMTLVSVVFALVGLHVGSSYVEQRTVAQLVSGEAGSPTAAEPLLGQVPDDQGFVPQTGPGPTVVEPREVEPASPTARTGAAASSVPSSSTVNDGPGAGSDGSDGLIESDSTSPTTTPGGSTVSAPKPQLEESGPEPAPEPEPASRPGPEARGRAALDRISYPWSTKLPGWTIEFHAERQGLYGLTMVDEQRIEIYIRGDQSDELLRHIVAHEIGHAVDVTLNSGDDRRRWQATRGIEDEPWWPDAAASDFRTGAGDFAESFAYWQTRSGSYRSKLGPPPDDNQMQLIAELAAG